MKSEELITENPEGTMQLAREIAEDLMYNKEGYGKIERGKAIIIGLQGELGAGKTVFVKGFARALGITQEITSPTFVIMKEYRIMNYELWDSGKSLIHIDAYRLDSGDDLRKIGIKEIFDNPENVVLIEWPERVWDVLPEDIVSIQFLHLRENKRRIVFK